MAGFSLKGAFWAVASVVAVEVVIFSLVHSNPAWMAVMSGITPTFNSLFDATGITKLGWGIADALGSGAADLAAQVGGTLAQTTAGESVMLPPL